MGLNYASARYGRLHATTGVAVKIAVSLRFPFAGLSCALVLATCLSGRLVIGCGESKREGGWGHMAWIESHQELGRHPKTRRAAKLLSTSRAAVIGHIHCLWWWALDFAQDGVLTKFDADEIADACLWDGEPEAFVTGLVGAGFLDAVDGQLVVHDWGEYAGRLIERRTSDAERKRRSRGNERMSGRPGDISAHAGADVRRTSSGLPADV